MLHPRSMAKCLLLLSPGALHAFQFPSVEAVGVAPLPRGSPLTRFAVIGDYGYGTPEEARVAGLVSAFRGQFVITTGDNNYPAGEASTIDVHIGQHYWRWIGNYAGAFGSAPSENRFFPCLGNHDWGTPGAAPYLAYFTLPGNERYYDFVRGPVHFYALDSDANEPDGITQTSLQAQWLQANLAVAPEPFQVVYFHHPPYSSGPHGNAVELQWPFRAWGADLVLNGHDHTYERILKDGFPYIVNGLAGAPKYTFGAPVAGSVFRFESDHGAMLVEADSEVMLLSFVTQAGYVQDRFTLPKNPVTPPVATLVPSGSNWRYLDGGVAPSATWKGRGFDDSSWATGNAQLGYGDGDEATVVSYGPSSTNKYVTTWFRRSFTVLDPSILVDLSLELVCDDGAVVYLNGAEVVRQNLPLGTIASSTLAVNGVSGAAESAFTGWSVSPSLVQAGANVLAVEMHQSAVTSSDLSFDLRLSGRTIGTRIVTTGSIWKYSDTGVTPPTSWSEPNFDDSSWSSGPAQLGYGDGDEATLVSYGTNPNQKHVTTWFRRSFQVNGTPNYQTLVLRLQRDDGAVVYLNGVEVARENLPHFDLAPHSRTQFALSGSDELAFQETFVDARLLHAGTNVLAVEIHQDSPATPDLSFDLELLGL